MGWIKKQKPQYAVATLRLFGTKKREEGQNEMSVKSEYRPGFADFIHLAGSIPRCLRRVRIENVFAPGSGTSRVRSGVIPR